MVLGNETRTIAVIPGVFMNENDRHAFLMVAYDNVSHYFRFPFEAFRSSAPDDEFRVTIETVEGEKHRNGLFSFDELRVDVDPIEGDDATEAVRMDLTLTDAARPTDVSWLMPGTMGPFSWLAIMQCNHHVLSMRHEIRGSIRIGAGDEQTNVTGIGYLEKDWGHSFPSTWMWGQANRWTGPVPVSASLFFSFASIPLGFGLELPGFLIIFEHEKQFYRFHSYLLSVVDQLEIDRQNHRFSFTVVDLLSRYKLTMTAHFNAANSGALLYGPRHGRMEKFVKEILDHHAYFDVQLTRVDPTVEQVVLFEARAHHVALEMNGDVTKLCEDFHKMHSYLHPWLVPLARTIIQHGYLILLLTSTVLALLAGIRVTRAE